MINMCLKKYIGSLETPYALEEEWEPCLNCSFMALLFVSSISTQKILCLDVVKSIRTSGFHVKTSPTKTLTDNYIATSKHRLTIASSTKSIARMFLEFFRCKE